MGQVASVAVRVFQIRSCHPEAGCWSLTRALLDKAVIKASRLVTKVFASNKAVSGLSFIAGLVSSVRRRFGRGIGTLGVAQLP
jgi:hypothetical protein